MEKLKYLQTHKEIILFSNVNEKLEYSKRQKNQSHDIKNKIKGILNKEFKSNKFLELIEQNLENKCKKD